MYLKARYIVFSSLVIVHYVLICYEIVTTPAAAHPRCAGNEIVAALSAAHL